MDVVFPDGGRHEWWPFLRVGYPSYTVRRAGQMSVSDAFRHFQTMGQHNSDIERR